jgi:hypothetical protein
LVAELFSTENELNVIKSRVCQVPSNALRSSISIFDESGGSLCSFAVREVDVCPEGLNVFRESNVLGIVCVLVFVLGS